MVIFQVNGLTVSIQSLRIDYGQVRFRDLSLAKQIVMRTSANMKLEDQAVSEERIKKAIDERTAIIKYELPKSLWD